MIFTIFDPERTHRTTETQLIGIALLGISLLSDGFLPDWQAEIKSEYKPKPREMLEIINKWVGLISLAWIIVVDRKFFETYDFIVTHPSFFTHLVYNAVLSYFGQSCVYWMVTEFKQHIVPFIISCRKIFTVCISIIYYKHETSFIQISGIIIVFFTVCFEFYSELKSKPQDL